MDKKLLLKTIIVLAVIGVLLSIYSSYHHFSKLEGVCNVNDTFSCDIVNRSLYSEIYGIPVAFMGFVGYFTLIMVTMSLMKNNNKVIARLLFILAFIGFLFTGYLTYIEAFKLYTYCLVCISSALLITIIFVISIVLLRKYNKE